MNELRVERQIPLIEYETLAVDTNASLPCGGSLIDYATGLLRPSSIILQHGDILKITSQTGHRQSVMAKVELNLILLEGELGEETQKEEIP